MTHHRAHGRNRNPVLGQPDRARRVAQAVPGEPAFEGAEPCRRLRLLQRALCVSLLDRAARGRAEHEVLAIGEGALHLPRHEQAAQLGEERDGALARLRLRRLGAAVREQRAPDADRVPGQVDVSPLKPANLSEAKPSEAREGLFARKQKERETQEKIAAAKEEFRIASLPRRLEFAEPGSIALPRTVFDWLLNPAAGSLDLPILGALVGLLFSFENQKPILSGAVFEKRDEELVLVCSEPFDRLRFTRTVNPNEGSDDFRTSGRVKAQPALRYLIQNNWLAATQEGGKLTIRLGERARKVREGKEAKPQAA